MGGPEGAKQAAAALRRQPFPLSAGVSGSRQADEGTVDARGLKLELAMESQMSLKGGPGDVTWGQAVELHHLACNGEA